MIAAPLEVTSQVELTRRRFSVEEYTRMVEMGLLGIDDRVELIWGEIVEMSPVNVAHVLCVNRLNTLLSTELAGRTIVSVQNPIQLDEFTLPQPDIALWKSPSDEYGNRLAGPSEVFLVVEVADSSIRYDKKTKVNLYGAAGIIEYWIVNLPARQIEVYREPQSDGYRMTIRYTSGESISCLAFPGIALKVDDIIGPTAE